MIRALIFDCFGVLYQGDKEYLVDHIDPGSRQSLEDLYVSLDYGYITIEEFLDRATSLLGISVDEIKAISRRSHVRNDELFTLIKRLKESYKLTLLSNAGKGVIEDLFGDDLKLFDEVIVSSTLGIIKPSPEIFEYTIERLGLPANECLAIDDIERNVTVATAAGMQALLYTTYDRLKADFAKIGIVTDA